MARIVLIEDSPTDSAVFSQWLEKAGHTVVATDNAEEGLELVRSQVPDLVLMDVVLPGMSGFQATRALARDQATKDIPVLLVSTKGRAWKPTGPGVCDKVPATTSSSRRAKTI